MGRRRQELYYTIPGSRSRRRKGCWVRSGQVRVRVRVQHAGGEGRPATWCAVHALPRLDFISFHFITVRDGASFLVTLFLWTDLSGGVVRTRPTTHSATAGLGVGDRQTGAQCNCRPPEACDHRVAKEDPLPTRRDFKKNCGKGLFFLVELQSLAEDCTDPAAIRYLFGAPHAGPALCGMQARAEGAWCLSASLDQVIRVYLPHRKPVATISN